MTPQDLKQIADLFEEKIDKHDKVVEALVESKLDQHDTKLEGKLFDWKSEIVDAVDAMSREIVDERDFREITTHQIVENRERVEKLEKKVFGAVQI